jgi:fermentation-respiration switch protein FrsA (DUF1100 family)
VRTRLILLALAAALALPAAAEAAMPFGLTCAPKAGVQFCQGNGANQRVHTFDGAPLDVDVTLPPASAGDGPFPTIAMLHGWGGDKTSFEADGPEGKSATNHQTYHYNNVWFAQQGYAVVTYSARGFGNSCGAPASRTDPGCPPHSTDQSAAGWIHLKDRRREAHDTQFLLGKLVDDGIADPQALGVTGISYGGGESIELAYLHNKTQLPNGTFVPWTSPGKGLPLSLAAAWPRWPWSDLVYSLLPNGRFLDFDNSTADDSRNPIGIPIQSYIAGLYALGNTSGWIAPAGADPHADLTTWNTRVAAGEPTDDPQTEQIANEIFNFHQGFACSGCGKPAPMLIQNGWTDDLFPPAEALRVYNTVRAKYRNADVSLQFADLGHDRGQNKTAVDDYLNDQGTRFLASRMRGAQGGPLPGSVTTFTQTCPATAPAGGPYRAGSWRAIHPGAVTYKSAATQQVSSAGGNPQTGQTLDPITGGGACATVANPDEKDAGTAVYNGPKSGNYTLLGLPTVRAKVVLTGDYGQLDSRLWDVAPNGDRVLVSRGAYRLRSKDSGKTITFQLHGNGWRFAAGHMPQLELLGRDAPYLRPSNSPFTVDVSSVTVELPTREKPGSRPVVRRPTISQPAAKRKKKLRITVKPRKTRVGKRTRFVFRVRVGKRNIRRATVKFVGRRHRTGRKGRTHYVKRFHKRGPRTAVARKRGYRTGRVKVRVKPRRSRSHRRVAADTGTAASAITGAGAGLTLTR